MVTGGTHYNNRCCFDYGNAEVNNLDDGAGTMEAVYFGSAKGGLNHGGAGSGPWIMADMENALWGADASLLLFLLCCSARFEVAGMENVRVGCRCKPVPFPSICL